MSSCSPINTYREMQDEGLAIIAQQGLTPFEVNLITIVTTATAGVSIRPGGPGCTDTRYSQRILVADGYNATDGYLNPLLTSLSDELVIMSSGRYDNKDMVLGPLVFPYTACSGASLGTDPSIFRASQANTQLYLEIFGPGMDPAGNKFTIKSTTTENNITYTVNVKNTGRIV